MNFTDVMFFIGFVVLIGITIAKFYNVMSLCKWYDLRITFVLFVGFLIAWGVTLISFLVDSTETLYMVLFRLGTILLALNTLFLFIEIIFHVKEVSVNEPKKAYNSLKQSMK